MAIVYEAEEHTVAMRPSLPWLIGKSRAPPPQRPATLLAATVRGYRAEPSATARRRDLEPG
jgi:hypothetical protein